VNRLLAPAVADLQRAHPLVALELVGDPRDLSLSRREADIALRLARPPGREAAIRTRCVGRLDYAAYGPRRRPATALPWIGYESRMDHLPQARWLSAAIHRDGNGTALAVNDAEALVQAVRAGVGKSLLPCAIADREPGLRRLDAKPILTRELWLLVHADMRQLPRIAATIDWIEAALRRAGVSA
jgi:DNA-binding transcriptional LysR family regulator